mmetsp:Transcript_5076/g.8652  ORF Transcript_5076/g.8652 Transcript_5076/m.8652 type:complete len:105 (-) Transcript_5076:112-426(-)
MREKGIPIDEESQPIVPDDTPDDHKDQDHEETMNDDPALRIVIWVVITVLIVILLTILAYYISKRRSHNRQLQSMSMGIYGSQKIFDDGINYSNTSSTSSSYLY